MDQTGELPDMEGLEDISDEKLVEFLTVEQQAHSRLASQLAKASDMRQELEHLLQSNSGKRPQGLPGVSRKRREELEMEFRIEASKMAGLSKDSDDLVYQPRFRPCCCGCGEMVLGEWTCDGEVQVTPMQRRALEHSKTAAEQAALARAQRLASDRLARPRPPRKSLEADPSPTPSASPPRRLDRQRLEKIALPREPPPEPKPPTPLPKARPAPARLPASASEAAPHVRLTPLEKKKVLKLSPTHSDLPGLSVLLHKASLTPATEFERPRLVQESDEEFWANMRRVDPIRSKEAQRSYVEARLCPKQAGPKSGTLADLEQRLQKAREERMALERELQQGPTKGKLRSLQ